MRSICRDCEREFGGGGRCSNCCSPRVLDHDELHDLFVAHLDCDAFYAAVEKRDRPEIRNRPVIIGGGKRGVVSTACYIARISGVRSAMPMFKALRLCPDAVVVKPRMAAYSEASKIIIGFMQELTPAVEPLSLDEAFIDLSGTQILHGASPAAMLVRLANRIEREVGVTCSVGLSHNKFLAKIASDLEKPRGFSIIGRQETERFLADKPVSLIWGIGRATKSRLEQVGIRTLRDLRRWTQSELQDRFDDMGIRLWHLCRGDDFRRVKPRRRAKSLSSEMTFEKDIADRDALKKHVWHLSERVADRLKAKQLAAQTVILKLKRSNHTTITRRASTPEPTQMAEHIFRISSGLLDAFPEPGPFRLLGVGVTGISKGKSDEDLGELLDEATRKSIQTERATDEIRAKFGPQAIVKGRALR